MFPYVLCALRFVRADKARIVSLSMLLALSISSGVAACRAMHSIGFIWCVRGVCGAGVCCVCTNECVMRVHYCSVLNVSMWLWFTDDGLHLHSLRHSRRHRRRRQNNCHFHRSSSAPFFRYNLVIANVYNLTII